MEQTNKKENIQSLIVLITLLLLNFVYRILVVYNFSFTITDNDQTIMWGATRDFALGQFHEPAFYGQNYNSMFEALLAAPFFKCGIPVMYILPIVTSSLALFPYFIIAILLFKKKQKWHAYLILAIPLLLPPQYDFITSLPRGFVTGIFFAGLGSIAIFYPDKKWAFFLFAFCSVTGYQLCPNCFLIIEVIGILLFLNNYKNKQFYGYSFLGFALGLIYPVYTINFYKQHPNYVLHSDWGFSFTPDNLLKGLNSMDEHFAYITPIYWYQSVFMLFIFALFLTVFFIQKDWPAFLASAVCLFLTIGTLIINKAHDGGETIFFSYSRLYLALPVVFALLSTRIRIRSGRFASLAVILVSVSFFSFKTINLQSNIKYAIRPGQKGGGVGYLTTEAMKHECKNINRICQGYQVELVVAISHWFAYCATACPSCEEDFPEILSRHDRRTWRFIEEKEKIRKTILFIDDSKTIEKAMDGPLKAEFHFTKLSDTDFILENNSTPTIELLNKLQVETRSF